MDWHLKTIETYDDSAAKLAEYFSGIGPRTEDIARALQLAGSPVLPRVVEIGCGDGRDAEEIVKRVDWYEGFDPSVGLLDIAKTNLPETSFVEADALSYTYPNSLNVVYAFASLLHVNKIDMPLVLNKISTSLTSDGILYMSLKEMDSYTEVIKSDEYGERMFYFYTPALIIEMAGENFTPTYEDHQHIGKTDWFTLALRKI